jgi:hypothetical protein
MYKGSCDNGIVVSIYLLSPVLVLTDFHVSYCESHVCKGFVHLSASYHDNCVEFYLGAVLATPLLAQYILCGTRSLNRKYGIFIISECLGFALMAHWFCI